MWGLDKVTTFLLAASNRNGYSPSSTVELAQNFRGVYATLGEKAPVFRQYSPTIKFSYVSPPQNDSEDWMDEHVMMADADVNRNEIFREVVHDG